MSYLTKQLIGGKWVEGDGAAVSVVNPATGQEMASVIRVNKEVPAHVANRLQAALWREALYLIESGVASVEDVDKAVWAGPDLRWAAMGPNMLFNLGAGKGGMEEFCNRYAESFHTWWDSMGDARLSPALANDLSKGLAEAANGQNISTLSSDRDAMIVGMLKATSKFRKNG